MIIYISWTELKSIINNRKLSLQYESFTDKYLLFTVDANIKYIVELWKDTSNIQGIDVSQNNIDIQDFENNYKSNANKPIDPKDSDGRTYIRSESRPLDCTSYFTGAGDSNNNIGDGTEFIWDFSNDENIINYSSGDEFKTKRIEFNFLDDIYLKEGAIYFINAPFRSYASLNVVCPSGFPYLDNNKDVQIATEDTIIDRFVNHQFMLGDCTIGDELNTESCSERIPSFYKFWIDITVPSECNNCQGHISLEFYRSRSVIL